MPPSAKVTTSSTTTASTADASSKRKSKLVVDNEEVDKRKSSSAASSSHKKKKKSKKKEKNRRPSFDENDFNTDDSEHSSNSASHRTGNSSDKRASLDQVNSNNNSNNNKSSNSSRRSRPIQRYHSAGQRNSMLAEMGQEYRHQQLEEQRKVLEDRKQQLERKRQQLEQQQQQHSQSAALQESFAQLTAQAEATRQVEEEARNAKRQAKEAERLETIRRKVQEEADKKHQAQIVEAKKEAERAARVKKKVAQETAKQEQAMRAEQRKEAERAERVRQKVEKERQGLGSAAAESEDGSFSDESEVSMELDVIMQDPPPVTASSAREKKRVLEQKYSTSGQNSTINNMSMTGSRSKSKPTKNKKSSVSHGSVSTTAKGSSLEMSGDSFENSTPYNNNSSGMGASQKITSKAFQNMDGSSRRTALPRRGSHSSGLNGSASSAFNGSGTELSSPRGRSRTSEQSPGRARSSSYDASTLIRDNTSQILKSPTKDSKRSRSIDPARQSPSASMSFHNSMRYDDRQMMLENGHQSWAVGGMQAPERPSLRGKRSMSSATGLGGGGRGGMLRQPSARNPLSRSAHGPAGGAGRGMSRQQSRQLSMSVHGPPSIGGRGSMYNSRMASQQLSRSTHGDTGRAIVRAQSMGAAHWGEQSRHSALERQKSVAAGRMTALERQKSVAAGRMEKEEAEEEEEVAPKPLVLIWLVVAGELGFDFGTTVIAFMSLLEEDDCCGYEIQLGPVPMSLTLPFFLLVAAELAMLIRAILLSLFPNIMKRTPEQTAKADLERSVFMRYFCCYLRWKVRVLMEILSFLVLLNPFFGCLIAWILLYQSDRTDAFLVLGFEGGALMLHYIAVCLEGSIVGLVTFFIHGIVPLIPFSTAIGLTLFYLKQGGVCYIVEESLFRFTGCEVCVDGYPPVNGTCYLKNGTTYEFVRSQILEVQGLRDITDVDQGVDILTSRADQVSYCAAQNPSGPQVDFCFFDFEEGKLDGLVVERTEAPTMVPVFSQNKCGATVPPGARLTQCTELLWTPTADSSMHCFASGGGGDPCHLSLINDGSNEGRFKDPSLCTIEEISDGFRAYGDVLYLWIEPEANGRDFAWAGNSWLAYSSSRFSEQMSTQRENGLQVASPQVHFTTAAGVRTAFRDFFEACGDPCSDPNSNAYIDILAVNVYCDLIIEPCDQTALSVAEAMTSISSEFGDRPVFVTRWGMKDTLDATKLAEAMSGVDSFFASVGSSSIKRVFWWSDLPGDDDGVASNLDYTLQNGKSLAEIWAEECSKLN